MLRPARRLCVFRQLLSRPSRAYCAVAAEEGPSASARVFGDEARIEEHEAQVNKHRDRFWPALYLVGALFGVATLRNLYTQFTTPDAQGKVMFKKMLYYKRDKILGEKPEHHNTNPTMLIDINDAMVHTSYREGTKGIQTIKRPGLDAFIEHTRDNYETVIFSFSEYPALMELITRLDPQQSFVSNAIPRELIKRIDTGEWPYGVIPSFIAPRYKKNLFDVGRTPERMIHIETDPDACVDDPAQNDNRIFIPRYEGDDTDMHLVHLIPFLDFLANKSAAPFDVRKSIRFYTHKMNEYGVDNIGVAFVLYQEEKKKRKLSQGDQPKQSLLGGLFSVF
ncbi:Mitochondrial import inner membrane translocase subunit TIM50 [Diplonema papillatum]|nr:Mitochondrial import inner membrane translocase subunit TIM50 [Diplonema papillatum]